MPFTFFSLSRVSRLRLLIVAVLLTATPLFLNAQTIKGIVYRANSDTTVANAIVYYGGSTTGTIANEHGGFELRVKPQQIPIIVSCVGYYSSTVYYETGKPLIVHLKPKTENLRTVTIRADRMDRKDEIARFKREFLGTSQYALSCTIENIDDINLFYDKDRQALTADCDKPIIIHNKKLGYTINYYLDRFKDTPEALTFAGNYIFKEDTAGAGKSWPKIIANREDAYEGSRMQFIRALWHNTLSKTGFKIFIDARDNPVSGSSLVKDSVNQKYIHFEGKLLVTTPAISLRESQVIQHTKYLFIDKSGYFGLGLQWVGPMASQRIGDLLPFEFRSKEEMGIYGATDTSPAQAALPAVNTVVEKPASAITSVEKAYLHTDRDMYGQGEDIWFKAYVVNARNNTPVNDSHNLYVELIGPGKKLVTRETIRLEDGLGNGDIKLADSIPAGAYRIRAYTNWMRNFGDNFIFEKNLTLLRTEKPAASTVTTKKAKRKPATVAPVIATVPTPIIRFFPEGGSLVEGISSIMGIKAEDDNGKGIPAKGSVISSSGDTISHFSCDSLGMGLLVLLPVKGSTYRAMVDLTAGATDAPAGARYDRLMFDLPSPLSKGLTLQIRQTDSMIRAVINNSDPLMAGTASFAIKHGGKTLATKTLQLLNPQTLVNIPADALPEGISAITVYNSQGKPECERLIYIHHPDSKPLLLTTDKTVYRPKEKVTANLKLNTTGIAHLSLAAVDAGTLPVQPDNIVSYLDLQSEIKGRIEDPGRYFDTTNVNRFKQMDVLLLTQGWRNFVWKRLEDTTLTLSYKPEQGIAITGRVRRVGVNKGLPGMNVTMRAPNAEGQKLFGAITDSTGSFAIYDAKFYGYQFIAFNSRRSDKINKNGQSKGESSGYIRVDSLLRDTLTIGPGAPVFKTDTARLAEAALARMIKNLGIKDDHKLKEVTIKANPNWKIFQMPPEIHPMTLVEQKDYINLAQYLLYMIDGSTLTWDVMDRHIATYKYFYGLETYNGKFFSIPGGLKRSNTPLRAVYQDGSRPERYLDNELLSLPMSNILKVIFNKDNHNNVMSVNLVIRSGVLEPKDYFDNTVADMVGYYKARTFYTPRLEDPAYIDPRTSTIHWEPNIAIDKTDGATISFYNTAQTGNISVIVQGITTKGVPLSTVVGYKVN